MDTFEVPTQLSSQGTNESRSAHSRAVGAGMPNAIDLSHHLNQLSKHRTASSLKSMYKYASIPGMIPMTGGVPSPDYFPYESISATILPVDHMPLNPPRTPSKPKKSLLSWLFSNNTSFTIPKHVENATPETVQLATWLQYQMATGPPALPLFLRQYVQRMYQPAYADWDVLINCGNTDAWGKVCFMLLERGDAVLVEEWTYPGAENSYLPLECENVGIKMDGEGVLPEHMEEVLSTWDEAKRGKKRPKLFYTVPTGQNPTGATMMGERKKAVYDVCCKYDVIICEDEPYFCLFTGPWTSRHDKSEKSILAQRQADAESKEGPEGRDAFINALPPTYLRYDTQGRVIRLDTFSKTSCPGSRLGWITTSPLFIERLTRATEASTQAPSGFVTAITTTMIQQWGFDGYVRWLRGIKATYKQKRDMAIDAMEDSFHLEFEVDKGYNPLVMDFMTGARAITGYAKQIGGSKEAAWDEKRGVQSKRGPPLISFIPPTAGMFLFVGVHLANHPRYQQLLKKGEDPVRVLSDELWLALADNLVLFGPGWAFDANDVHAIGGKGSGVGYFRLSYSIVTPEQMKTAASTFAKVLTKFFVL